MWVRPWHVSFYNISAKADTLIHFLTRHAETLHAFSVRDRSLQDDGDDWTALLPQIRALMAPEEVHFGGHLWAAGPVRDWLH